MFYANADRRSMDTTVGNDIIKPRLFRDVITKIGSLLFREKLGNLMK